MTLASVLITLAILVASVFTVGSNRLVHAVLWLGLMLAGTAVLFLKLDAPFLASIQLLLYVGGVMTLMIFGVMLSRRPGTLDAPVDVRSVQRGAIVSTALFVVLAGAVLGTRGLSRMPRPTGDTAALGHSMLTEHLMAFELLSAVLLAAMIGAIVLARRRDPGEPPRDVWSVKPSGASTRRTRP